MTKPKYKKLYDIHQIKQDLGVTTNMLSLLEYEQYFNNDSCVYIDVLKPEYLAKLKELGYDTKRGMINWWW